MSVDEINSPNQIISEWKGFDNLSEASDNFPTIKFELFNRDIRANLDRLIQSMKKL